MAPANEATLITKLRLELLRATYPELAQGETDAKTGKWRDFHGYTQNMAYEIGRMLALEEMLATDLGLIRLPSYVERAIRDLELVSNVPECLR